MSAGYLNIAASGCIAVYQVFLGLGCTRCSTWNNGDGNGNGNGDGNSTKSDARRRSTWNINALLQAPKPADASDSAVVDEPGPPQQLIRPASDVVVRRLTDHQ